MRTESQRGSSMKQATPECLDSDGQETGQDSTRASHSKKMEFSGFDEYCTATSANPTTHPAAQRKRSSNMPGDTACKVPDVKGEQKMEAGRLSTMPKLPPVPKRKAPHDNRVVRTILDQPVDNNLSPRKKRGKYGEKPGCERVRRGFASEGEKSSSQGRFGPAGESRKQARGGAFDDNGLPEGTSVDPKYGRGAAQDIGSGMRTDRDPIRNGKAEMEQREQREDAGEQWRGGGPMSKTEVARGCGSARLRGAGGDARKDFVQREVSRNRMMDDWNDKEAYADEFAMMGGSRVGRVVAGGRRNAWAAGGRHNAWAAGWGGSGKSRRELDEEREWRREERNMCGVKHLVGEREKEELLAMQCQLVSLVGRRKEPALMWPDSSSLLLKTEDKEATHHLSGHGWANGVEREIATVVSSERDGKEARLHRNPAPPALVRGTPWSTGAWQQLAKDGDDEPGDDVDDDQSSNASGLVGANEDGLESVAQSTEEEDAKVEDSEPECELLVEAAATSFQACVAGVGGGEDDTSCHGRSDATCAGRSDAASQESHGRSVKRAASATATMEILRGREEDEGSAAGSAHGKFRKDVSPGKDVDAPRREWDSCFGDVGGTSAKQATAAAVSSGVAEDEGQVKRSLERVDAERLEAAHEPKWTARERGDGREVDEEERYESNQGVMKGVRTEISSIQQSREDDAIIIDDDDDADCWREKEAGGEEKDEERQPGDGRGSKRVVKEEEKVPRKNEEELDADAQQPREAKGAIQGAQRYELVRRGKLIAVPGMDSDPSELAVTAKILDMEVQRATGRVKNMSVGAMMPRVKKPTHDQFYYEVEPMVLDQTASKERSQTGLWKRSGQVQTTSNSKPPTPDQSPSTELQVQTVSNVQTASKDRLQKVVEKTEQEAQQAQHEVLQGVLQEVLQGAHQGTHQEALQGAQQEAQAEVKVKKVSAQVSDEGWTIYLRYGGKTKRVKNVCELVQELRKKESGISKMEATELASELKMKMSQEDATIISRQEVIEWVEKRRSAMIDSEKCEDKAQRKDTKGDQNLKDIQQQNGVKKDADVREKALPGSAKEVLTADDQVKTLASPNHGHRNHSHIAIGEDGKPWGAWSCWPCKWAKQGRDFCRIKKKHVRCDYWQDPGFSKPGVQPTMKWETKKEPLSGRKQMRPAPSKVKKIRGKEVQGAKPTEIEWLENKRTLAGFQRKVEQHIFDKVTRSKGGRAIACPGHHPHALAKDSPPPSVCVIGAGAAGLAAARQLMNAGAKVTIIESRTRLGGRLNTITLPARMDSNLAEQSVDLGATFVHGCHDLERNLVYNLAAEFQTSQAKREKGMKVQGGVSSWSAACHEEYCRVGEKGKPLLDRVGEGYSSGWAISDSCTWYHVDDDEDSQASRQPKIPPNKARVAFNALEMIRSKVQETSNTRWKEKLEDLSLSEALGKLDGGVMGMSEGLDSVEQKMLDSLKVLTWSYVGQLSELSLLTNTPPSIDDTPFPGPPNPPGLCSRCAQDGHAAGVSTEEEGAGEGDWAEEEEEWSDDDLSDWSEDEYLGDDGLVVGGYGNLVVELLRPREAEMLEGGPCSMLLGTEVRSVILDSGSGSGKVKVAWQKAEEGSKGPCKADGGVDSEGRETRNPRVTYPGSGHVAAPPLEGKGGHQDFDFCVVTLPLGVMKLCDPELPKEDQKVQFGGGEGLRGDFRSEAKIQAIRKLGMGTENKIVIRFESRFWPKSYDHAYMNCTDPRFRLLSYDHLGKTGLLVAHVSPPWALWLCRDKKKTPGEIAHVDLDGRDAAGRDLSGGEWGQQREMTDEEVISELIKVLAKMFPQQKKAVGRPPFKPHAAEGQGNDRAQVLEQMILDHRVTRWQSDTHSYGAYSYLKKGSTFKDLYAMSVPEPDPLYGPVFFAGEATASPEGMQCVHGAFETGRNAADRILQLWHLRNGACVRCKGDASCRDRA